MGPQLSLYRLESAVHAHSSQKLEKESVLFISELSQVFSRDQKRVGEGGRSWRLLGLKEGMLQSWEGPLRAGGSGKWDLESCRPPPEGQLLFGPLLGHLGGGTRPFAFFVWGTVSGRPLHLATVSQAEFRG